MLSYLNLADFTRDIGAEGGKRKASPASGLLSEFPIDTVPACIFCSGFVPPAAAPERNTTNYFF